MSNVRAVLVFICMLAFFSVVVRADAGEAEYAGIFVQIAQFFESFPAWLTAITGVVTASTAITALTPSKHDDVIINKILSVLNFLAGNVLKNKNADDV